MRINLIANNNNNNIILNISNFININICKLNYYYNLKKLNMFNIINNNKYYIKYIKKNSIPIIYNYKNKIQKFKLYNNLKKEKLNRI
jgi:hypothetical protein